MTDMSTCTITTSADGGKCGKPAVTSFTSRRGETFHECAEHASGWVDTPFTPTGADHTPARIRRRTTTRPFVLVRHGAIVGYADARTEAVEKRARRLGATIVAVQR